jgi:hypothetical protein
VWGVVRSHSARTKKRLPKQNWEGGGKGGGAKEGKSQATTTQEEDDRRVANAERHSSFGAELTGRAAGMGGARFGWGVVVALCVCCGL